MSRFRLAVRLLASSPRRATLLVAAIALCLNGSLLADWMVRSVTAQIAALVRDTETADARLAVAATDDRQPLAPIFRGAIAGRMLSAPELERLLARLANLSVTASPRLALRGNRNGRQIALVGAEFDAERRVLPGIDFEAAEGSTGFTVIPPSGKPVVLSPAVTYAAAGDNRYVGATRLYLDREQLIALLEAGSHAESDRVALESPAATEILLRFGPQSDVFARSYDVQTLLAGEFPGVEVQPWQELVPEIALMADSRIARSATLVLYLLAAIIVGTAASLHLATRRTELLVLTTLGMTAADLTGLLVIEGALVGGAGSACGLSLAAATRWIINEFGIRLPASLLDAMPRLRLVGKAEVFVGPAAGPAMLMVLTVIIVTYWAVRRRVRIPIARGLREVM